MNILISNREFTYHLGCRILKLRYKEPIEGLEDIWDDIEPLSLDEVFQLKNIEERRIAINYYGLERLHKELDAELVDRSVIKKKSCWVLENGKKQHIEYDDVYELYKISKDVLFKDVDNFRIRDVYYVVFKDTSTERKYLLWVDRDNVLLTNGPDNDYSSKEITAIEAIAWTITTNVPINYIKSIIRQGDCILIQPFQNYITLPYYRHLTKNEYLTLLTNES